MRGAVLAGILHGKFSRGKLEDIEEKLALPDFDCWHSGHVPQDVWNDVYDLANSLEGPFQALRNSGGSRKQEPISAEWLRALGKKHLQNLFGYAASGLEDELRKYCPYSLLPLKFAKRVACLLVTAGVADMPEECKNLKAGISEILAPPATLQTLLNSRWLQPFCGVMQFIKKLARVPPLLAKVDPDGYLKDFLDCTLLPADRSDGVMNWYAYLQVFMSDELSAMDLPDDWVMKTFKYAFTPNFPRFFRKAMEECSFGFTTLALSKLYLAQASKTEEYEKFAVGLRQVLLDLEDEDAFRDLDIWTALIVTRWPILPILCTISRAAQGHTTDFKRGYQYKPYSLDFYQSEILHPRSARSQLTHARSLSSSDHMYGLAVASRQKHISTPYRVLIHALFSVLKTFEASVPGVVGTKLVIVTMVWGSRLSKYLPGVLQRAQSFGLKDRYVIFCLDEHAIAACHEVHSMAHCVPGERQTIYNKYTILAAVVQLGFDALYLDFDTLLMKDPVPVLLREAEGAEVLVSRDFGSECLNTGVIYLKAHPDTAELLVSLLVWLWHHPYEFSQKAFSAFLGVENVTDSRFFSLPTHTSTQAMDFSKRLTMPRWGILDPMNAFVTSAVYELGIEGWTGSFEGIVIFHFLDGTGGVDPDRAVEGKYLNLYDLLYDNPKLDLMDNDRPLWIQDARIERVLLRSRLPKPPSTLERCRLIDNVVS